MNSFKLVYTNIAMFLCLSSILYISLPGLDHNGFYLLNGQLYFYPHALLVFIACLNHEFENYLNLALIMMSIVLGKPKEQSSAQYIGMIICAIIWYELCFQCISSLEDHNYFTRSSPSYSLHVFNLNEVVPFKTKVFASSCFPSGHAMTMGYWSALANILFKKSIRGPILILSISGCLPRLIAGAHWVSDVLMGYCLGQIFFSAYYQIIVSMKTSQKELSTVV